MDAIVMFPKRKPYWLPIFNNILKESKLGIITDVYHTHIRGYHESITLQYNWKIPKQHSTQAFFYNIQNALSIQHCNTKRTTPSFLPAVSMHGMEGFPLQDCFSSIYVSACGKGKSNLVAAPGYCKEQLGNVIRVIISLHLLRRLSTEFGVERKA